MAEQQLPVWNNEGVEPPANLQIDGWQPGVKPPAQYFDWLFNRAYKCLEELQAITEALETNKANGTDLTTLNNKVTQHLDEEAMEAKLGHVKQSVTALANVVAKRDGSGGLFAIGQTATNSVLAMYWRGVTSYVNNATLITPPISNMGGSSYLLNVEIGVASNGAYNGLYVVHFQNTGKILTPIISLNSEITVTLNEDLTITIKHGGTGSRTIYATLLRVV